MKKLMILGAVTVLALTACDRSVGKKQALEGEEPRDVAEDAGGDKPAPADLPWPVVTIIDKDKLGEKVADGSVTVAFGIETAHADQFTILCRAGNRTGLTAKEPEACEEEYEVSDVADDVEHVFEIHARRNGDAAATRILDSVAFTHLKYDIIVSGEAQLRNQRSGIIHLGLSLNKPRLVYFICGAETSFHDASMDCRDGRFTVNLNRFAGGVYFTIGAYDAKTNEKIVERNLPFCAGQLCAQGVNIPPPPHEKPAPRWPW